MACLQSLAKYRLCQIDTTVRFSTMLHFRVVIFLKVYIYCKLVPILDIVSSSYSLYQSFYYFVKHRPEKKKNLSLPSEIDVLSYFTLTC